jgi:hypothetical protein
MDQVPLWLQNTALLIVVPLAVEVGFRAHGVIARLRGRTHLPAREDGTWETVTGASISVLGILLAFTVSMAVERYEDRRELVVSEANAISSTYLLAQVFDEPARGRLSSLLWKYARDRRLIFEAGDNRTRMYQAQAVTGENQRLLWNASRDAVRQRADAFWTIPYMQSATKMFDLADTRHASLDATLPQRVTRTLIAYSVVTALLVGYGLASANNRHRAASTLLFVMIALIIVLILDLDHPRSGAIKVPERPLENVTAMIAQSESAKSQDRTHLPPT